MRNQILLCVRSLIVITFICASVITMAHAQNVPPPPAQSSDRFGVYHWNPDYSGFPGTLNQQFAALNDLIASTKTRTIRIALGSGNMAVGKAATQSSTAFDGYPERAVDGPYDGVYFRSNTVTHTNVETAPWWQVDLGGVQTIGSVRIWNRTDCCSERLSNFYVFVSDTPFTSGDLTTTINQPGVSNWYFSGQAGTAESFSINRTGQYVRVQLSGTGVLSLAEVQVFESMIKVADSEPFKSLFSDPRFDTIFVTTFGPQTFDWGGYVKQNPSCVPDCNPIHLPPPNYNVEYQHVNALASYLTGIDPGTGTYRFPRKKFIILNWESDSDLGYWVESLAFPVGQKFLADRDDPRIDAYWDEFIKLHQTRSNAVRDAKTIQPGSPADPNRPKLYSGFEISLTYRLDRQIGANLGRCGSAGRPTWCAIDHVAPKLAVDYYSYSAWDSTSSRKATNFNAYLPFELKNDLVFALNKVNTDRLDSNTYTMTNFVLGEVGMSNHPLADNFGAQYVKEVDSAVDALGLSYAIWWQAKDNNFQLWVDDTTPSSATRGVEGGDVWHDITANPTPVYGQKAFQTENKSGQHGIYFENTNPNVNPVFYLPSSELNTYVYVYLDPVSPPQAVMLEWQDNTGSKEHRAFWGADLINKGAFDTPSRRPMGALPATGQWVRLEVKAGDVDLGTSADKQIIKGFGVYLYNGKATWDYHGSNDKFGLFTTDQDNVVRGTARKESFSSSNTADVVWVDEDSDIPVGNRLVFSEAGGTESWEVLNRAAVPHPAPMPVSGQYAFRTQNSLGTNPQAGHRIYFENAATTMTVNPGDVLFAYVYLDPDNPPEELLLEWRASTGVGDLWNHRAYWGVNHFNLGSNGGPSRRRIGESMPPLGRWVRLEIPAKLVGLEGNTVTGFGFALFKGRGAFDRLGKRSNDVVWADEDTHIPPGARFADSWGMGSESWEVLDGNAFPQPNPLPVSGRYAFRTKNSLGDNPPGLHQIWFSNPANPLTINGGDILFAYVYLDPLNPPQELMLQWCGGSCEHRAYWGPGLTGSVFGWGTDGESSRRPISYSLPPLGQWVRLEVPASLVGLEGQTITGFAFTLYGGRGAFDRIGKTTKDVIWLDEDADIPIANRFQDGGDSWSASTIAAPISGNQAFQTISAAGLHQLYTFGLTNTLAVNAGDALFAYVYLDPASPPTELMLQWNDGSWEHRAYWGANNISYGNDGTTTRQYMGPLPPAGQWVRLEVPASQVALEGSTVGGMSFTLYDGSATWDHAGKAAVTFTN
ncbi:MAG TPA: discoidin domain-containing protein, partial [Pyrinomonadaceae bacterium]|nr:discoidin domain-containing protein [Pyrinomonadaceae bacterium]